MVPVYYEKSAFFRISNRIKTWARFIKFGRPISVLKFKAENILTWYLQHYQYKALTIGRISSLNLDVCQTR